MHTRTLLILAAAGAIGVAPWVAAQPAHADVNDISYIATLQTYGIPVDSIRDAIALGHAICDAFDAGADHIDVIAAIVTGGANYFAPSQAASLVGAATSSYCPEHNVGHGDYEVA